MSAKNILRMRLLAALYIFFCYFLVLLIMVINLHSMNGIERALRRIARKFGTEKIEIAAADYNCTLCPSWDVTNNINTTESPFQAME